MAVESYNGTYKPSETKAYRISRSKIELFLQCPRCFWLDRRAKVERPSGPPFTINSAVDTLLKREFDAHRVQGKKHPLQEQYGVDAEPVAHDMLDKWRENFHGVQAYHEKTNLLIFGAIDDLWMNSKGEYIVVDYKATAKAEPVKVLGDAPWHDQYRRQIEFYQWLLRRNSLPVSSVGYWVYCTGNPNSASFDRKVEFDVYLISYNGDDGWVEPTIIEAHTCLQSKHLPAAALACEFCSYTTQKQAAENSSVFSQSQSQDRLF